MPARTGEQFLAGLKNDGREIWSETNGSTMRPSIPRSAVRRVPSPVCSTCNINRRTHA
jgi:hypothetical protein